MKTTFNSLLCSLVLLLCAMAAPIAHAAKKNSDQGLVARGKAAIEKRGCVACHTIPGIPNPGSNVGPPLTRIAKRAYLAGVLPNTRANMERWISNPQAVSPRSAMPNMGIGPDEAKAIAAYLYTLD